MTYHHLSLDFWHTLGEPNKRYGEVRGEILADYYHSTPQQALLTYKDLKRNWERDACLTGKVPQLEELHRQLDRYFGYSIHPEKFRCMVDDMVAMFHQHPPALMLAELAKLDKLRRYCTLSIGSNTNFIIRGVSIQRLLPDDLFDFQHYSDQLGCCKPSGEFFSNVVLQAAHSNPALGKPQEILHIGDSVEHDYKAPHRYGISAAVCGPNNPLMQILTEVETSLRAKERTNA